MISREELNDYAKIKKFNLGQAEKDFYQDIVLFIIYEEYGKELVFKGGTALTKCYNFDRFSEDLDFTCNIKSNKFKEIINNGLKRFIVDFEVNEIVNDISISLTYYIKGPLHIGTKTSICKLILDISLRENVILEPKLKKIGLFNPKIPPFDVIVMNEEEILAEKIRAILTRTKGRDLYDLYWLCYRDIKIDLAIVKQKLKYYGLSFKHDDFEKAINKIEKVWITELKYLVKSFPDFDDVKKSVLERVKNA